MPRRRDQELLRALGKRVAQARRDRGWTQDALSTAIGIEAVTLSRLETGDRALSLTMLAAIAESLGVALADLVDVARPAPIKEVTPEVAELLRLYGTLPASAREAVMRVVRELAKA